MLEFPPFSLMKAHPRLKRVVDVRCRGVVPVISLVGAVWPELVDGGGDCRREVDRRLAGIPALLSEVDLRLGVGVQEDGNISFPEAVCGSCEDRVNT